MKLRRRMIVGKRVIQPNRPHTFLGNLKKLIWRDNLPEGVEMQSSSSVVRSFLVRRTRLVEIFLHMIATEPVPGYSTA